MTVGVAGGILGCALLAGCGQPDSSARQADRPSGSPAASGDPATPGRDDELAAWVDEYCGAAADVVDAASRFPEIDASSPDRTSATSARLLTVMIGGFDTALERLRGLGETGVDGVERVRVSTVEAYGRVREQAVAAKRALDRRGADAVGAVRTTLDRVGTLDLLGDLDRVPELRDAGTRSGTCGQLTARGDARIAGR
ncbi:MULTISPECIES: hypothetical protein [Prauserella salsuginis group]|uniref:Uncharacterized protein n=2 Tax=Prauserella salsuginis group TaxID=2893672 RepID=A0A839XL15_9PSEU|nr:MULTISPECIES: hypothetical protein [Prauserella salsuginis group]MBB3663287.1 hypothetical protein [Prauserella sediminis]MCR3720886.1 hypothetical protein [Prauserella flava]MCR3735033.1 hypothetical protein [Prauserella salsuginis]